MMFQVKDIMVTHVVTVQADDPIDRAIGLMVKHRISGLPVLNRQGHPIGILSEFDLLNLICDGCDDDAKVCDYMTPRVLHSVNEDDNWVCVADSFRKNRIRRLPVLRDGRLVGIVTRHDLMHAIRDARRKIRQEVFHLVPESNDQPF